MSSLAFRNAANTQHPAIAIEVSMRKDNQIWRIVGKPARGRIFVNRNTQFNDVNAELVEIGKNVSARIFGTIDSLVLNEGSKLHLHGSVKNVLRNPGSMLIVYRLPEETMDNPAQNGTDHR